MKPAHARHLLAWTLLGGVLSLLAFAPDTALAHKADSSKPTRVASANAPARVASFDPRMLAGSTASKVDVSRFEHANVVSPGTYNVDVYVNDHWKGRTNVRFAQPRPGAETTTCINSAFLKLTQLTAQSKTIQEGSSSQHSNPRCRELGTIIPGATADFDMNNLRLNVSVPQALMNHRPRGYVSPSSWSPGVPAFRLNYNFNAYHTRSQGSTGTNAFLGLNAGLNLGLWRLRQRSIANWRGEQGGESSQFQWSNIETFAQRDLPGMQSTLTLGDSFTDGAVFDSFGLRGLQIATNDRMRPQSRRGFAPTIRGSAESNAKVTVHQNGILIYTTTVSPGPFVINDLYPTGYGGDLVVTVTEANGRKHSFRVPYASVSQLQRPGITRYDIAGGLLRNLPYDSNFGVLESTIQHGFTNLFTGYGGVQFSDGYYSALFGGAFNTPVGAFALDFTEAATQLPGRSSVTGQSVRLSWNNVIAPSQTYVSMAAYRYSTSGFYSLGEATRARDAITHGQATSNLLLHERNRFTLNVDQPLGENRGSLTATASYRSYWDRNHADASYRLGYRNHFRRLSYNIAISRTRDQNGRYDNQVHLNLSVPLGSFRHAPSLSANFSHDNHGNGREQALISGTAGQYSQFNYGAGISNAGGNGGDTSGSLNAGYRGSKGELNASYSKGEGYSQTSVGASGAVIAHSGGITFGRPLGRTTALVHVPGGAGAHVENSPGVTVDGNGYAIVPYLSPYQLDSVRVDPKGLALGVQLGATSANVAPYGGAVVQLDFKTRYGRALIADITQPDGRPAPFGAEVINAEGKHVGVVGQNGRALLRVHRPSGKLTVHWQADHTSPDTCWFRYALHKKVTRRHNHSYQRMETTCTTDPAH